MKGRLRCLIAIMLACSILFGLLFSGNVFAANNSSTGTGAEKQTEGTDNLGMSDGSLSASDMENISAAAIYIRGQMTQRKTVITGTFSISNMANMDSVFQTLSDQIFYKC